MTDTSTTTINLDADNVEAAVLKFCTEYANRAHVDPSYREWAAHLDAGAFPVVAALLGMTEPRLRQAVADCGKPPRPIAARPQWAALAMNLLLAEALVEVTA